MRIGLAAYRFINNDVAFNKSQMEKAMKAARGKAQLLCFGETFLQGFDAMNWAFSHDREVGVTQDSDHIKAICDLTMKYGVDVLFGYLERDGDQLFSSCMVVEDGRIIHNYRRVSQGWKYYWITDEHYREGNIVSDFSYKGRKFRIALCGDLWEYPERFRTEGILIWPVYVNFSLREWAQYESEYAQQAALAAAKTLLVNSITLDPEAVGGAFLYEGGQIAAQLPYNMEEILYVDL